MKEWKIIIARSQLPWNIPTQCQLGEVLGRTQFVGSNFRIFDGFGWVLGLLFGFVWWTQVRKGLSRVCPDLGQASAHFWPNMFEVQAFLTGLKGFEFWFWFMRVRISKVRLIWIQSATNTGRFLAPDSMKNWFCLFDLEMCDSFQKKVFGYSLDKKWILWIGFFYFTSKQPMQYYY